MAISQPFEAAKRENAFAIEDPELAALMLLGGLRSVLRFGSRPRPADQAERIVAGFLNGYGVTHSECQSARKEKRTPRSRLASADVQVIDGATPSLHNA